VLIVSLDQHRIAQLHSRSKGNQATAGIHVQGLGRFVKWFAPTGAPMDQDRCIRPQARPERRSIKVFSRCSAFLLRESSQCVPDLLAALL
jgi:hypothetical protein